MVILLLLYRFKFKSLWKYQEKQPIRFKYMTTMDREYKVTLTIRASVKNSE